MKFFTKHQWLKIFNLSVLCEAFLWARTFSGFNFSISSRVLSCFLSMHSCNRANFCEVMWVRFQRIWTSLFFGMCWSLKCKRIQSQRYTWCMHCCGMEVGFKRRLVFEMCSEEWENKWHFRVCILSHKQPCLKISSKTFGWHRAWLSACSYLLSFHNVWEEVSLLGNMLN